MTASEMVRSALAGAGKTQKELAEYMGWSPQNLSSRLKNGTLTFDELNKALGFVGYSVKMVSSTGSEPPDLGNSGSPRVVQMVGGVTYDTSKTMNNFKKGMEESEAEDETTAKAETQTEKKDDEE